MLESVVGSPHSEKFDKNIYVGVYDCEVDNIRICYDFYVILDISTNKYVKLKCVSESLVKIKKKGSSRQSNSL